MQIGERGKRVTIYVGGSSEQHAWRTTHRILERLHAEGAANVAAFKAAAAVDAAGRVQGLRLADVVPDLPMLIVWIDTPERVEQILPHISGVLSEGTITVEEAQIAYHVTRTVPDLPPAVTVGEVMTREVVAVHPETPMRELVDDLVERSFRAVPVIDADRRVIGIITNGDLVRRGGLPVHLGLLQSFDIPSIHEQLAKLAEPHRQAGEIMTSPAVTVRPELHVQHAAELMLKRKLKRLPVVDAEGLLLGIVSRVDLLHTIAGAHDQPGPEGARPLHANGTTPVKNIMATAVPTMAAESPLPQVVNVVMSTRLNRAVVVDSTRHVLGVVTEAELVERLTPEARPGALSVFMHHIPFIHGSREMEEMLQHTTGKTARDVMRTDIVVAREDEPVRDVLAAMLRQGKKIVPIVNQAGELTGMVDRADLLRALVEAHD